MIFLRCGMRLALGLALVSFHFATLQRCFAVEVSKTVENPDPPAQMPESGKLPSALVSLNAESGLFARFAFLVDKRTRTLSVWEIGGDKVKFIDAFPADLGARSGDKKKAGDLRTPEGIYFIQDSMDGTKLDADKYGDKIFTLDYPNTFDKIEKKTGTGIWLHAISDKKSLQRGSHGCVVVRNKTILDLAKYIELKRTPLIVSDAVEYLTENEWKASQEKLKTMLEEINAKKIKALQVYNQGRKIVARVLETEKSELQNELSARTLYALKGERGGIEILSENLQVQ